MRGIQMFPPKTSPIFRHLAGLGLALTMALGLALPAHAEAPKDPAASRALETVNEVLTGNPGDAALDFTREAAGSAIKQGIKNSQKTAWRGNKMGAAPAATANHLGIKDSLKNASGLLHVGEVLIDHADHTSSAAGEMVEGNYAQGFITLVNGFGKSVASGIGSAAGASIGSLGGPVGTLAGGAGGGYLGNEAWDVSMGKLTGALKTGLAKQEAKRQFRQMAGPLMLGRTADGIHAAYLNYRQEEDAKKKAGAAKAVTAKPTAGAAKLGLGSQTAVYDPYNGGGDSIRVTVSGVANFKQQSVPGWRNNGTSFGASASRGTPITIQGTLVGKPWSYYDFKNSVTIKAEGQVVFSQAPAIPKEGGSASFSFTFDPGKYPGAHSLSIDVSSTGGNPESSTHWVGGTIQIAD